MYALINNLTLAIYTCNNYCNYDKLRIDLDDTVHQTQM